MARAALEVNGAALVGASARGVLFNEPGVAFLDGRQMLFGHEAAQAARSAPELSYRNYWESLSDTPLARPARQFRTAADLAHAQLARLWRRFQEAGGGIDGVLLAVPAGASEDRLALLLGIAEEAGLPVAGLVESAVAAVGRIAAKRSCVHVEATGERIVASRLEQRAGRIHSAEILFDGRPGLRHLRAAMTAYAAGRFVAASRFDPLDLPDTERQLAEKLEGWLEELATRGELRVELDAAPIPASAQLRRDEFMAVLERQFAACGNRLRSFCTGRGAAPVCLTAALAAMPGCADAFARLLAVEVQSLQPGAAALGALARMPSAAGGAGRHVLLRSLQASDSAAEALAGVSQAQEAAGGPEPEGRMDGEAQRLPPTHLVRGASAWRIIADGLRLGSAPEPGGLAVVLPPEAGVSRNHCTVALENGQALLHDHSRYGTRLNGAPVAESAPLRGGDRLNVGPVEFLVTREVSRDGA